LCDASANTTRMLYNGMMSTVKEEAVCGKGMYD